VLPDALKRVLAADASGFADDALLAYAAPEDDLRGSRAVAAGRDAIAIALEERGPQPAQVVACLVAGYSLMAEGRLEDASFVASLQLDCDGRTRRALWLSSAPVARSPPWGGGVGENPDARPILDRYFSHLQAGRFRKAVGCFSEDCRYSHPPYAGCSARLEFRGRDELLEGFENKRGPSPARQIVTALLQRGRDCIVEGVVDGIPNGGSFISSLSLADDGRIRRYAAWYCAPRVDRREDVS
jgi:SnoaL-like protein